MPTTYDEFGTVLSSTPDDEGTTDSPNNTAPPASPTNKTNLYQARGDATAPAVTRCEIGKDCARSCGRSALAIA